MHSKFRKASASARTNTGAGASGQSNWVRASLRGERHRPSNADAEEDHVVNLHKGLIEGSRARGPPSPAAIVYPQRRCAGNVVRESIREGEEHGVLLDGFLRDEDVPDGAIAPARRTFSIFIASSTSIGSFIHGLSGSTSTSSTLPGMGARSSLAADAPASSRPMRSISCSRSPWTTHRSATPSNRMSHVPSHPVEATRYAVRCGPTRPRVHRGELSKLPGLPSGIA